MVDSFWCFTCTTAKEEKNIFGSCVLCFPFVISQAERHTRGLLGSVGRAFTLVCLWGDYNLNAASLEAFSHSSFSVPRTKLVIFVLLKFGKKFNREISHFNLSSKDLDKCELN